VLKEIIPLMLLSLFCQVTVVTAGDVLVVQSMPIKPYNEALRGFRSICSDATRNLTSFELSEADVVKKVRKSEPDLILAIGMDALQKVKEIRDVPIVYLMVLNPQSLTLDAGNITGVSMSIQPERQLAMLQQVLPHARRIGLPFDHDKSGSFVRKAQNAAAAMGIELLAKRVQSSRDAAAALDGMKGKIDVFWMIPDTTVVNSGSVDLLLLSAIENRIPVLAFSEKYAEKGALLSMEVDAAEAGRQAGEMANSILAGKAVKSIEKTDARGVILTVNMIVAKKLGIPVNGAVLGQARVIR